MNFSTAQKATAKGMFVKYLFSISGLGLACLVGLGCGGSGDKWTANQPDTVDASGIVTLDGEPVEGATVVFGPIDGKYPAHAITESDGSFSAAAFTSKAGAVPGKYKVALTKTIEDKDAKKRKFDPGEDSEHAKDGGGDVSWANELPEIYKLPNTTPVEIEVPAGGVSDLKIELTSQ
ncbi:MAG: carboxypeptidase-like regulatory domain-containing protein [Fuerstiella sp.]